MPYSDQAGREITEDAVIDVSLPSVFIDQTLLRQRTQDTDIITGYKINDTVFFDEPNTEEHNRIVQFDLYAEGNNLIFKMYGSNDLFHTSPKISENEVDEHQNASYNQNTSTSLTLPSDLDKTLDLDIIEVPKGQGYIINKNIYLTIHQWNTLIFIDVKLVQCAVCDVYTDLESSQKHLDELTHTVNLVSSQPLYEYDLCIVRKMQNKYHCGVCNQLFFISNEKEHFAGKIHESNLLFALNKAIDVIYDNKLNVDNDTEYNDNGSSDNGSDGNGKADVYHFNTNNIVDRASSTSDSYCDYDYTNYNNNENLKYIDFQNKYNDYYNEPEAEVTTPSGISYANIAKTPKVHSEKFLYRDVGNKRVKVLFSSWHMIISPEVNRFYCMACRIFDHIRRKQEHCSDSEHVANVNRCTIVEAYEEYFIRQVDDKLYHCGHCNKLQLIHEIADHVETNHPRRTRTNSESAKPKESSPAASGNGGMKDKNALNDSQSVKQTSRAGTPVKNTGNKPPNRNESHIGSPVRHTIETSTNMPPTNMPKNHFSTKTTPISKAKNVNNETKNNQNKTGNQRKDYLHGIFDDIVIYPFGYKLTLPLMAFNVVCRRENDFYCGICDVIYPDSLIAIHINEIGHIQFLQRTPFIQPFSCNMIRAIRDALHCGICNIPIKAEQIYQHIADNQHKEALKKALGIHNHNTNRMSQSPNNTKPSPNEVPASLRPNNLQNVSTNVPNAAQNVPNSVPSGTQNGVHRSIKFNIPESIEKTALEVQRALIDRFESPTTQKMTNNAQNTQNATQSTFNAQIVVKDNAKTEKKSTIAKKTFYPILNPPTSANYFRASAIHNVLNTAKDEPNYTQNVPNKENVSIYDQNTPNAAKKDPIILQNVPSCGNNVSSATQNVPDTRNVKITVENDTNVHYSQHTIKHVASYDQVALNATHNIPKAQKPFYATENSQNVAESSTQQEALRVTNTPQNVPALNVQNIPKTAQNAAQTEPKPAQNAPNTAQIVQIPNITQTDKSTPESEEESSCEDFNETLDSQTSEDATFDVEEYVYLKLKNTYIKISNTSYNTLVSLGDGSRYCFVCSVQIEFVILQRHVDSRAHLENIEKYRFLDKYEDHLLRQIFLMYHCGICNVIVTRKELKNHVDWATHTLHNDTLKNIKKTRKNEIKSGIKQIIVSTQKENIYLNERETKVNILLNINVAKGKEKSNSVTQLTLESDVKKSKIIIFNDNVLKVSWDKWHGICKIKNGYKCILCQRELRAKEIETHCASEWHNYGLDKPFQRQHAPALVRKITEAVFNCVICNSEVSHKEHFVTEHINGKKHVRNYDAILNDSSSADTYTDCNDDVLMIE